MPVLSEIFDSNYQEPVSVFGAFSVSIRPDLLPTHHQHRPMPKV